MRDGAKGEGSKTAEERRGERREERKGGERRRERNRSEPEQDKQLIYCFAFVAGIPQLHVPLMAIVDYRGFRLVGTKDPPFFQHPLLLFELLPQ